jgi:hypothetical protein
MTAFANITPTIARLIRLLGSDQDHETLGAARALRRVLGSAGLDLHDLASTFELSVRRGVPQVAPQTASSDTADHLADEIFRLQRERPGLLSAKELEFVRSMKMWRREPTERQKDWLFDIYSRCLRGECSGDDRSPA